MIPRLTSQFVLAISVCLISLPGIYADSVWPKPLNQTTSSRVLYLDIEKFHFKSIGSDSLVLQRAFERYEDYIFGTPAHVPVSERSTGRVKQAEQGVHRLKVYVALNDQSLNLQTDESYALIVSAPTSTLEANSVYGALRGLETFSQLIERIDVAEWDSLAETGSSSTEGSSDGMVSDLKLPTLNRKLLQDQSQQAVEQAQPFEIPVSMSVGLSPQTEARNVGVEPVSDSVASRGAGSAGSLLAQQQWLSSNPQDPYWDTESGEDEEGDEEWTSTWEIAQDTDNDSHGSDQGKGRSASEDAEGDDSGDYSDDDTDSDNSDSFEKHHKHKHKKQHKHKKHHKKHRRRHSMMYTVNATAIWDTPRFAHRGLLLDSSRHFLPVDILKENLDAMAAVKMNVLHWHIVDDQSFPYESDALPRLSEYGAYSPDHIYTPGDVAEVVSYARDRGIRVIPEFDTPGHTASWGSGYPELLTDCYDSEERPTGVKGPVNPARNETYALLWKLLREAAAVFPDSYIHLGGDEVPFDCWKSSPEIKVFMAQQGLESVADLETYFEGRVLGLARQAGRKYIVWQEILDNGVQIEKDTVVHVWKWWAVGMGQGSIESSGPAVCELSKGCKPDEAQPLAAGASSAWADELAKVTAKGYKALLSSPWYLNLGAYADEAWATYYKVEPLEFNAPPEQMQLVIGGEACMWGEWADASNVVQETWPRAAAIAERLWSDRAVNDVDEARPRFKENRCRLLARGISASPGTGPGFCPTDNNA